MTDRGVKTIVNRFKEGGRRIWKKTKGGLSPRALDWMRIQDVERRRVGREVSERWLMSNRDGVSEG